MPKTQLRPTLDRAKETLFNCLQFELEGVRVLDVFAGSGALGLEAFSRGASHVTFIDSDAESCNCIKRNCALVGCVQDVIGLHFSDAFRRLCQRGDKYNVVLIDPPYESGYYDEALKLLTSACLLADGAIVVAEHSYEIQLPVCVGSLTQYKTKKVGTVGFTFYKFDDTKPDNNKGEN